MSTETTTFGYSSNADFWVKIIREDLDRYRLELTNKALFEAVGAVDGLNVLDAGCGEGYLSRELASKGAQVTGIELNSELLEAAIDLEQEEPLGVSFIEGSITDPIDTETEFDVCVLNHVLNDIQDIEKAFKRIRDVSKPGGKLVALVLHPCFYLDGLREESHKWPEDYFNVRSKLKGFNVAGIESPAPVEAWYRPLEDYAKCLADNGYVITNLSEPHPTPEQMEDPWWQQSWKRPMFLLISTQLAI